MSGSEMPERSIRDSARGLLCVKAREKPGYPRFKGAGHFDTVQFPKDGDGCRWDSTPHDSQSRVRLQGVGHVRVHQHRPVKGRVKTISVKREGRRWYVILACDQVPAEPLPATGSIVGIDMGTVHFFTDSNGEHIENPCFLQMVAQELSAAQRHLDTFPKRTRRRTKRHRAAARKVAKIHAKIRRQRLDHHHKAANELIRDHDVIAHERLNTAGMSKAPAPKPDPRQRRRVPAEWSRCQGWAESQHSGCGLGVVLRNPGGQG